MINVEYVYFRQCHLTPFCRRQIFKTCLFSVVNFCWNLFLQETQELLLNAAGVELRLPTKLPSATKVKRKQVRWFLIEACLFFYNLLRCILNLTQHRMDLCCSIVARNPFNYRRVFICIQHLSCGFPITIYFYMKCQPAGNPQIKKRFAKLACGNSMKCHEY